MIISESRKFIFFHCRKTAGSSVVVSLARFLAPNDLQVSAISETLSHGIGLTERTMAAARDGARRPLLLSKLRGKTSYGRAVSNAVQNSLRDKLGPKPQHPPAVRVRDAFPDLFGHAFKFGIIRNPWDRAVSDFFWMTRELVERPSFEDWMRAIETDQKLAGISPRKLHDNWPIFADGDKVLADRMIRFEHLENDLREVAEELQLSWDGWLPRAKSKSRKAVAKSGYRDLHTSETQAIVKRLYGREIDLFGYTF